MCRDDWMCCFLWEVKQKEVYGWVTNYQGYNYFSTVLYIETFVPVMFQSISWVGRVDGSSQQQVEYKCFLTVEVVTHQISKATDEPSCQKAY